MNPKQFPAPLQPVARLIKAGRTAEARTLLRPILHADSKNADAWYLASLLTDKTPQKIVALKRALALNPNHTQAQTSLAQLQTVDDLLDSVAVAVPQAPPAKSVPPKPEPAVQNTYAQKQKRIFIIAAIMGLGLMLLLVFIINTPQKQFAMFGSRGSIIFNVDMGGQHDIYIMDAASLYPIDLTPGYADDESPALSPDGTQIAFTSNRDGRSDIYVMNSDGRNARRLTFDVYLKDKPAWSPDGKTILYQKKLHDHWALYLMNADGSSTRPLLQADGFDYRHGKWSPDGTQIAFTSNSDGNDEIYVMNADTTNLRRLTDNGVKDYAPSWSPDSSQIAFTSWRYNAEERTSLYVMDADGQNQRILLEKANDAEWSPDGDRIIFSGFMDVSDEIYMIDAAGGDPTRLTDFPGLASFPSWGYVNTGTATASVTSEPLPYEIVFSSSVKRDRQLFTVNAACASTPAGCINAAVPLLTSIDTRLYINDEQPVWSPDGSKVAFITSTDIGGKVAVWDTVTGQQRLLTDDEFVEQDPAWSPDGTQIAFISQRGTFKNIYLMDADGQNIRPLTTTDINENPVWSPDGTQIAFISVIPSTVDVPFCSNVFVIDVDGSNRRNLTNECATYESLAWSPDGQQILFATPYHTPQYSERNAYFVMDADGSNKRELLLNTDSTGNWLRGGGAAWTPDGEYVVFGGKDIFLIRLDGSFIQRLTNSWDGDSDPSVRLLP